MNRRFSLDIDLTGQPQDRNISELCNRKPLSRQRDDIQKMWEQFYNLVEDCHEEYRPPCGQL